MLSEGENFVVRLKFFLNKQSSFCVFFLDDRNLSKVESLRVLTLVKQISNSYKAFSQHESDKTPTLLRVTLKNYLHVMMLKPYI